MPVAEKIVRNKKIYKDWKMGKGYKILAKEYGFNYITIRNIVKRWQKKDGFVKTEFQKRKISASEIKKLRDLNYSYAQIGKLWGLSRQRVHQIMIAGGG